LARLHLANEIAHGRTVLMSVRERSNLPSGEMKCEVHTQRTYNPAIALPEVSEVFGH
jgi:hypothetical protein